MAERTVQVKFGDETVPGVVVPISSIHEGQSNYILSDGSMLQMRTVVAQVVRLVDRWNDEGDPVYVVKSQNILTTSSPEGLRRTT